ncbi:MAG TPA: S1 RNA-binding domain-containing protein, partial [Granulicella sp.]|nr:S1 RNA-binding domain-containing protein [Granulicella sp.]
MVDDHNPDYTESKPLNTEIETLAPEATADHSAPSSESTTTQTSASLHPEAGTAPSAAASETAAAVETADLQANEEPDYDAADFAAALANFDREQAAESAAAQNLTAEEVIVTGTVVKITDKHVVVDIGLKSEGLIPLEQVLDVNGVSKFQAGDTVEVVVEREEPEGGYLVSYDKAQRHKVWDKLELAANEKTPVKGMVLSRVKGGLTVDIGIKAFLPGSQVEVRPVRNLDGYIGTEIEVRVIKLNKKRGNVVISRKELLEEDQNAKKSVTLATLEEGSILTGSVKNLTDYGAFVDLG